MRVRGFVSIVAAIGMLVGAVCSYAQTTASCTFSTFKPPSGYTTAFLNGINDYGTMVGTVAYQPDQTSYFQYGLTRYSNGNMSVYKYPNSFNTFLTRRNNSGVTVGYDETSTGRHGIVKNGSNVVVVNYPAAGQPDTVLMGINKWGTIVGRYLTYVSGQPYFSGFKLQNGKYTKIWYPNSTDTQPQAINDNGVIVGWYTNSPTNGSYRYFKGFILQNGTYKAFNNPQGTNLLGTQLNDINVHGVIAGNWVKYDVNNEWQLHGFIYENGTFKNVVYPNAISTTVMGINNYNNVVGYAQVGATTSYNYIPFKAYCK